ncbi:hypothetical protein EYF80_060834 [Liparis tanakae]|uniref:Uncharacterized protein n=1 Tax=Liparis tanakae TaxID=230148 RepID=A0A4Z2EJP0_9TELE|nr:hypothetical protein EYF80_060834 [Liparis tanakae]
MEPREQGRQSCFTTCCAAACCRWLAAVSRWMLCSWTPTTVWTCYDCSFSRSTFWRLPCRRGLDSRSSSSTASLLSIGWTDARAEPASPNRKRNSASVRSCWSGCSGRRPAPRWLSW